MKRSIFYISDRTGITAEAFGQALITQFKELEYTETTMAYVDSPKKIAEAVRLIDETAERDGLRPIVFDTIVKKSLRDQLKECNAMIMDFFSTFMGSLEQELEMKSSEKVGQTHALKDLQAYDSRMEAVNFALNNDDGATTRNYEDADLILVGVSRCGKTPTSLYLAMQFGLKIANYPFIAEDMDKLSLPHELKKYKSKVYGLTINPVRLHDIRTERLANSQYAAQTQCNLEVRTVEQLYRKEKIPFLNTTKRSIEEIATKILVACNLRRNTTTL